MNSHHLIPFLKTVALFEKFSYQELLDLLPFLHTFVYPPGSKIISEGETGRELLILKSGKVEVYKEEFVSGKWQHLGELKPGDYFGEMAHIENHPRSASILAREQVQIVAIDLNGLREAEGKEAIYLKILVPLVRTLSSRLRKTDEILIDYLKEKLKFLRTHEQISKTIIQIVILMALWFNLSKLLVFFPSSYQIIDTIFTTTLLLAFAASTIYVIKTSGYPLDFYGLTFHRWFRNALNGALSALPILAVLLLIKWFIITYFSAFREIPLFSLEQLQEKKESILIFGGIYLLTVPVQELIARGGLQSTFRNFFQGPRRSFYAILTSNLLFQMVHTVKGFWIAIFSFFMGIYWGYLFEKQKSLIGVCVSHGLIGFGALFILDYETIAIIAK